MDDSALGHFNISSLPPEAMGFSSGIYSEGLVAFLEVSREKHGPCTPLNGFSGVVYFNYDFYYILEQLYECI